jgi:ureidoacrylate peracid hydrolase
MIRPMLTLDARPRAVTLDPERTAVLVVDFQHDFASSGGMFARAGIDVSGIQAAATATRPVLAAAREAAIPIVYLKMEHAPDLWDVGPEDGPHWLKHEPMRVGEEVEAPDGRPSRILVRDTWNTDIVPELAPEPGDVVVSKHRYSGFFETELDAVLHRLRAKYLLVTGCTTSICVESTVRDAMFRDYSCIVLEDCTAEPIGAGASRTNKEASLLVIETLFGWISSGAAVMQALAARAQLVS